VKKSDTYHLISPLLFDIGKLLENNRLRITGKLLRLCICLRPLWHPRVNFINILRLHFLYKSLFKAKLLAEKSCSKDFCMKNVRVKCWWNWLPSTIEANNIEYENIEKCGGWLNRNHSGGNIEFNFKNGNIDSKTGSNGVIASPIIISRGPPPPTGDPVWPPVWPPFLKLNSMLPFSMLTFSMITFFDVPVFDVTYFSPINFDKLFH